LDSQPAPLGDVLASNWVQGSVARDDLASRLRFPNQILCVVTGKDDAEGFYFCGPCPKALTTNLQSRFLEQICVIRRTILWETSIP